MGRRPLLLWLLASHVGLLLILTTALIGTGLESIRSAVVGYARAEAERAVVEARRRLSSWRRDLSAAAERLAQQPDLAVRLTQGDTAALQAIASTVRPDGGFEYLELRRAGRTIFSSGATPPARTSGLVFAADGTPWRVVRAAVAALPDAEVMLAAPWRRRLGAGHDRAAINLALQPLPAPALAGSEPAAAAWHELLRRVAASGDPETVEAIAGSAVARVVALRDVAGRPEALLSARVAPEWVAQRRLEWLTGFALASLAAGLIVCALSALLAARIARPFAQLSNQAQRLAGGDLATPIVAPTGLVAEPAALAQSLEHMRQRVAALTAAERARRQELDALLDGVDEGIVGIDDAGHVHYANRQFLALLGRERGAVIGVPVEQMLGAAATEQAAAPDAGTGTAIFVQGRWLTLRRPAAAGAPQILIVREETAAEAARALRDRILANLSHEFQTPLAAQLASIELLRDHLRVHPDAVARQLVDAQYRGALRLAQLVDNLLDSVRIDSGEMRLRRAPLDLAEVIEGAVELMQPLLEQREQRVVLDLAAGPALIADAQRLASVIVNLLGNANKYAPDQSLIRVTLRWTATTANVWVEDQGPGLPTPIAAEDLFTPFRRAADSEPSERGSGLGLAIVHAIVSAHGGEVRVAENSPGQGARIGIVLPVPAAPAEPQR